MLIAIVMYLVIGGIIIVLCEKELMEVVENYTLAKKNLIFRIDDYRSAISICMGLSKRHLSTRQKMKILEI